jgi:hypothetical protein
MKVLPKQLGAEDKMKTRDPRQKTAGGAEG